ncbi:hypothetical protein SD81_034380 [Tolypothrix campylonemoides VB511288]|nr:hypothetical protein SD81_034380 [Tolypothrix campylonemoides VB511288]
MNFFQNLPFNLLPRKPQNSSGIDPLLKSQQPVVLKPSAPVPSRPKTLAEIEQEIEAQAQIHRTYSYKPGAKKQRRLFSRMLSAAILLGVPIGVIWVANLPYPVIRRPVARNAPILLLPSYISMENNYREAIAQSADAKGVSQQLNKPNN